MSNQATMIEKTKAFVQDTLKGDASGHDWWHIDRVHRLAKYIADREGADGFVVELAALLHDIADWKFHEGDLLAGGRVATEWLRSLNVSEAMTDHVARIINASSFKGAHVPDVMTCLEGQVLQDADRLDAMGAIGIARTFAYGGSKRRTMYDPNEAPLLHNSFDSYQNSTSCTINHFYEKLLLLKDRMHTKTGKALAEKRHCVLEDFLKQFLSEWREAL